MKIAVIGPGAMGCLFSHYLFRAGHEVMLLDYRPERARVIAEQGVRVEEGGEVLTSRVPITADPHAAGEAELCIVAVKAYATREALARARPLIGLRTLVLSLQNGLGNVELIAESVPAERVLGGTTAQGANVIGAGHIRHAGTGETVLGAVGGAEEGAAAVAEVFRQAGLPARTTADLAGLIWSKVLVNIGINALTALTHLPNGKLLEYPGTRAVMAAAVKEAEAVARALGIHLLYPDAVARVEEVARATAANISSMLQDVRSGRRTEVDQIQGAVIAAGHGRGMSLPVNETLWRLVKTLEASYADQLRN